MEKISLEMGVMWWYEQASEKYGTLVSPELKGGVRELLFSMPFMQANPTMRRLCVSVFSDFFDYEWHRVCILFYLLGKYGLHIEMSKEEMDEYEGKAVSKADNIDWEQRRWELARDLWELNYDTSTPATCVEQANELIEEYEKSIEKGSVNQIFQKQ